jgi:thiamine biosynthesis lipoprotein
MSLPFPQNPLAGGAHSSSTRRLRVALGTWVAIEARVVSPGTFEAGGTDEPPVPRPETPRDGDSEAAERAAIEAAYAAILDIDTRMHPHREGSEIARINSTQPGTPVEIQPDTWRLLQLARRLYDLTGGIFDPCLPTRPGRLGDIEIQPDMPALVCHAPVTLDLGGIAKGHAIDRAVEKLQELGCASGLVNAGGDLRIFGERAETIFLRRQGGTTKLSPSETTNPSGGDNAGLYAINLQNAALAVSDLDAANRPSEHYGYYIRGRDRDVTTLRYAAVIAPTAAVADALTKCVLLCPGEQATRVLDELQAVRHNVR